MPVFLLNDRLFFPNPEMANENGLLAVGGDLTIDRLILAYKHGIFPWYGPGDPICWWSPDPRLILKPLELHISKRLKRTMRQRPFSLTMDHAFEEVIKSCAETRLERGESTWLTPEMQNAYIALHHGGYAHSAEAWRHDKLAGGLYGVALGRVFFGESMFSRESDASKIAFVTLVRKLAQWDFFMIDCQMTTQHLVKFGACEISRKSFISKLHEFTAIPSRAPADKWSGF
ncbi:MAG TPA: leucyl/phenylalanyl-tRNA--protein transferase [Thermodesulfobacteriaceae bacterium]|nr:leucyl/phenylalanyl-tRNA--protein transferase [Thermodesulfobacteriaceae bacterium]